MRPAPPRPLHQARGVQLGLHEGVTPAEAVVARQVLMEMLHVPAPIGAAIEVEHPLPLRRRHLLRRRPAVPAIAQPLLPVLPRSDPESAGTAAPILQASPRHPSSTARRLPTGSID